MSRRAKLAASLCGLAILPTWPTACGGSSSGVDHIASYVTGVHPNDAAIGDFDGDGDLDVVVPGVLSPPIATLWNDAGTVRYSLEAPLESGAAYASAVDLDGDGTDELLLCHHEWLQIEVLHAVSGSWTVGAPIPIEKVEQVRAADLDGDNRPDLAITRFLLDDVVLLLSSGGSADGQGAARFGPPIISPAARGPIPLVLIDTKATSAIAIGAAAGDALAVHRFDSESETAIEVARLDTPEWPAGLALSRSGNRLVGTANLGDTMFLLRPSADDILAGAQPEIEVIDTGFGPLGATWYAGDTRLAVANKFGDTLMIFDMEGPEPILLDEIDSASGPSPVLALDLVGDEREELVVVDAFEDSVSIYRTDL